MLMRLPTVEPLRCSAVVVIVITALRDQLMFLLMVA